LDLINIAIGKAIVRASLGTPIVTTAKTARFIVPNSHMENITSSITTKPIKRPFIVVLIIAPECPKLNSGVS